MLVEQLKVVGFDHIVLNVADVEASLSFYCGKLGLEAVRLEEWRAGKNRFPSVRVNADTILDLAPGARSGENLDHFCLVIEAMDLDELSKSGELDVVREPGTRYGARGDGTSLYVRDPDGNVVELRYYD